jgi:hypothetical protein
MRVEPECARFGRIDPPLAFGFGQAVEKLERKEVCCEELYHAVTEVIAK